MAIAPLPDLLTAPNGEDALELPWPTPSGSPLRLVADDRALVEADAVPLTQPVPLTDPDAWGGGSEWVDGDPGAPAHHRRASGRSVRPVRRTPSSAVRRRRRRLLLGATAVGLVTALALPLTGLAGRPAGRHPAAGASQAAATGATVYVVRPGDTLWSIASRFDAGGDPRPLAEAMARETGSATVVPGERITIP